MVTLIENWRTEFQIMEKEPIKYGQPSLGKDKHFAFYNQKSAVCSLQSNQLIKNHLSSVNPTLDFQVHHIHSMLQRQQIKLCKGF